MLLHNKKGSFLPMFIVVIPIILAAILLVMNITEAKKTDLVGLKSINLIKAYDEAEKINLFIDLSVKYASYSALSKLADNGGYNENNRCEKTQQTVVDQEQFIILNTCPILNINEEFKMQIKKEIKSYLNLYKSGYKETELEENQYNEIYTNKTRSSNILSLDDSENNLLFTLSDIPLPVGGSENSVIVISPKPKFGKPDFSIYENLYTTIRNNCISKEFLDCKTEIQQKFASAEVTKENELIKIKIPTQKFTIKLAFLQNREIPSYQKF